MLCDVWCVMRCDFCMTCGVMFFYVWHVVGCDVMWCDVMWCHVWCLCAVICFVLRCDNVMSCVQWHKLPKTIHNHNPGTQLQYQSSLSCQSMPTQPHVPKPVHIHNHCPQLQFSPTSITHNPRCQRAKYCSMKQRKKLDARKCMQTINKRTAVRVPEIPILQEQ